MQTAACKHEAKMEHMQNDTLTKKRLSATVYYLLTGLALGWPAVLASGYLLPIWRTGGINTPISLAVIHLLALGAMLTVAFGVLYQIVPIAFRADPIPRHVLFWHLPLHILSVLMMIIGFLLHQFHTVALFGSVFLCNSIAYFALIARSYLHAKNKTQVHKRLVFPMVSLWLVLFVGMGQAFFPSRVTSSMLFSHAVLGGFAFWGGLVLVFSYKLVPMFAISHGYKASLPRSVSLYDSGVVLWLASSWLPQEILHIVIKDIGNLLIVLGLLAYALDLMRIIRARKRKKLVWPMYDALLSTCFFVLGQIGIILAATFDTLFWLYLSTYLLVFGGLIGLMFAYMQKIIPFLWFEYRFSRRPERKTAPLIDEMVPKRIAQAGVGMYFLGVILGCCGILLQGPSGLSICLDWISASCLTMGSVLLFASLRHVLTIGGPRPDKETN